MTTTIKAGVEFGRLIRGELVIWRPVMWAAHELVVEVFDSFGSGTMITSALDGTHSKGSLHYKGLATDYRIWNVPEARRSELRSQVAETLGDDFDVVLESTHLHVEYDPK
jgi:hypothetical protein